MVKHSSGHVCIHTFGPPKANKFELDGLLLRGGGGESLKDYTILNSTIAVSSYGGL